MKSRAAVTAVLLAIMFAVPQVADAVGVHYFDCKECHDPTLSITQLGNSNVCRQCHDNPSVATNMNTVPQTSLAPAEGFLEGDASNIYGTGAVGQNTSHNFGAPTDVVPAAGAQAPSQTSHPQFYTRYGASHGKITCSRCHNPHGDAATNPLLLVTGDGTTDQMCLACHVGFDLPSSDHGLVGHPVGMDYAAVAAAKPDQYKATPDNGGTNGNVALLADGTVSCTTCHSVHFADSDAATVDDFNNAGAGDGYLLTHNGPDAEDPTLNNSICQTCHTYEGHGMNSASPMGCMVCHGGHEYDAAAPNYFMLKKTINLPTAGGADGDGNVHLDYTADPTTMTNYDNGTGTFGAICIDCHGALPAGHQASDACADCHSHEQATGSFGAGCGSCHGYAPYLDADGSVTAGGYAVSTQSGNDYSSATGVFKDESRTPHAAHANGGANYTFSCDVCHGEGAGSPSAGNHDTGSFQNVLDKSGLTLPALSAGGVYTTSGAGTCDSVYCHSNGDPRSGTIAYSSVDWALGAGTIIGQAGECQACHGNDAATMASAGNSAGHQKHLGGGGANAILGKTYSCAVCHDSTATGSTALQASAIGGVHVDGAKDVAGNLVAAGLTGTITYDGTAGTCATVYCHSDGNGTYLSPDWDLADGATPTSCTLCHNNGTDDGTIANAAPASGAHVRHVADADGPQLACDVCHTTGSANGGHADHLDGNIDTLANLQTAVCDSCHGVDGTEPSPVWTDAASMDCATCHTGTLSTMAGVVDKTQAELTGHNQASGTYAVTGNAAAALDCLACHEAAAGGHLDAATGDLRLQAGFDCLSCHDGSSATLVATHTNIGASIKTEADFTRACLDCHDPHGDPTNAAMINVAGVIFTARTGADSFDEADAANADDICATCHTTTSHNNQAVDGSHNEGADCMTCHGHDVGFMPAGGNSCEECHSAKLAEPRHAAHIDIAGSVDTDVSDCAVCHPSVATYTIDGGSADHFGNSANDFAAGITNPQSAGTTCSSAMGCHNSTVADGSWQDSDGLSCDACHYQAADPTQAANTGDANPVSAGHNVHFADGGAVVCIDCHGAATDTTHIDDFDTVADNDGTVLTDRANAAQDEATVVASGFDDPSNTCSTATCHQSGRPADDYVATSAWGSDDPNCTQCHQATPATGSHGAHVANTNDCASCHTDAVKDTSYNSTNHLDLNVDVAVGGYSADKALGSAFESCANISCHGDGLNAGGGNTPVWGTSAGCAACHESNMTTGSHSAHLADGAACGDCHDAADPATETAPAQHSDGDIDVYATAAGDLGYPQDAAIGSGSWSTCSTASCHDDGTGTLATTPAWGTASACAECHAAAPATGSHGEHLANVDLTVGCGDCHSGAVEGSDAGTAHRDDNIDTVAALGYTQDKVKGSAYESCATASCHDDGTGTVVATPNWGSDTNCATCHATQPATGSHTAHVVDGGAACGACHDSAVEGSNAGANHLDADIDTVLALGYTQNKTKGSAYESCATVSCHGDGLNPGDGVTPVWGTAAGCAACHESNMTTGSHSVHLADGAACADCHDAADPATETAPAQHSDGDVDVYATAAGDLGYTANAAIGTGSWTTCNAASCHDDGTGTLATTPAWGTTSACAECHAAVPATGSHTSHLADAAVDCIDCHDGAVEGSDAGTAHRDNTIDTVAALGYTQNKTKGSAYETCATASCHDDGRNSGLTDTWGTTLNNCSECHATQPATGSHGEHLANTDLTIACADCHDSAVEGSTAPAGHRDGDIDVYDTTAGDLGFPQDKGLGTAFTSCTTASCHDDGTGTVVATPTWGSNTGCATCHATQPGTGSHTAHVVDGGAACGACHDSAVEGSNAGANHLDTDIDTLVALGYTQNKIKGSAYESCATVSCHGDGLNPGDGATPVWGTAAGCAACHEANMTTGSHSVHLTDTGGSCVACHDNADPTTETAPAQHSDGNVDVFDTASGDLGYTANAAIGTGSWTTCNAASCHDDGTGTLATTPAWGTTSACAECHAAAPATGSHGEHLANVDLTVGCGDCHSGAVEGSDAGTAHRDDNIDTVAALGYTQDKVKGSAYESCATASCHDDGTGTVVATPNWGSDTNCATCHATQPATGSHTAHVVDGGAACGACHDSAVEGSNAGANHLDADIDTVLALGYTQNKTKGSAYESCATVSCHGDGLNPGDGATPVWGTAAGCAACHEANMTTGSHSVHLTDTGGSCVACHDNADPTTETAPAQHSDGNVDVFDTASGDLGYTANAAIGTGSWTTCNAASCHDDGTGTLATTPAWGTTSACAECHAAAPATGSHGSHLGATAFGTAIGCGDCHSGAAEGTDAGTAHRDTNIDTVGALGYTQDKAKGSAYESCATVDCHSDGMSATGATPVWGAAGDCTSCHASDMATGSHGAHLASSEMSIGCGDCHDGAVKDSTAPATHIDGNVDVFDTAAGDLGYIQDAAYGSGSWTTCNAASCHDDGTGTAVATPAWGTASACAECHLDDMVSGSHGTHLATAISSGGISCDTCHGDANKGVSAATGVHLDGNVDVYATAAGDLGYPTSNPKGDGYQSCATSYCHGDTLKYSATDGIDTSPMWGASLGTDPNNCDACHGYPVDGGGAHPNNTDCSACHDHVNASDDGFIDASLHIDGTVQITGGDACIDCHGGGAYADPDSGDHAVHTDADTLLVGLSLTGGDYGTAANWYSVTYDATGRPLMGCGQCHPATESTHLSGLPANVDVDPAGETITAPNAKLGSQAGAVYNAGTCSGVYCHSDGAGSFADSPSWNAIGGDAGTDCASCHGNSPTTNAHGVHEVGIHYDELYDDDGVGLMAASPTETATTGSADSAHGGTTGTGTITCFTCHSGTVADSANAGNATCGSCHSDTNSIVTGNELARIQNSTADHLNGQADVAFATIGGAFRSKAQVRDDITQVAELNTSWSRTNGYKAVDGTSYDLAQGIPSYTGGTCSSVACHNGIDATWQPPQNNCMNCHTELPQ